MYVALIPPEIKNSLMPLIAPLILITLGSLECSNISFVQLFFSCMHPAQFWQLVVSLQIIWLFHAIPRKRSFKNEQQSVFIQRNALVKFWLSSLCGSSGVFKWWTAVMVTHVSQKKKELITVLSFCKNHSSGALHFCASEAKTFPARFGLSTRHWRKPTRMRTPTKLAVSLNKRIRERKLLLWSVVWRMSYEMNLAERRRKPFLLQVLCRCPWRSDIYKACCTEHIKFDLQSYDQMGIDSDSSFLGMLTWLKISQTEC